MSFAGDPVFSACTTDGRELECACVVVGAALVVLVIICACVCLRRQASGTLAPRPQVHYKHQPPETQSPGPASTDLSSAHVSDDYKSGSEGDPSQSTQPRFSTHESENSLYLEFTNKPR
ncbi:uncharacterized protein [Cherax quadricarinatus]|uniref:uncharacterized protein n=1 Tax=Cherax quadricarinatus TaxID=27406 RepID=UPI002377FC3D|nr:uncharacterized protein LOC128696127 [Cherax quadricarinatus]